MQKAKDYIKDINMTYQGASMTNVDKMDDNEILKYPNIDRQPLPLPDVLEGEEKDGSMHYHVVAQEGETEFFPNIQSPSKGYNGNVLGPVLRMRQGQKIEIATENKLDEVTTYHWHGLILDEMADGGPMKRVEPGETEHVHFQMQNEAGMYWFHPHPYLKTPRQAYEGMAGLIIVDDDNSDRLKDNLPHTYGVDDLPLVLQDRYFVGGKIDYEASENMDGTKGDHLLVNGALMPKFEADTQFLRLRLLSGVNRTNFKISLSDGGNFFQIGTDGGFLNHPLYINETTFGAAERLDLVLDLSEYEGERLFLNVNDFQALQIDVAEDLKENADFSHRLSLREDLFNYIYPEDVKDLELRHIILQGTDENVAINNRKFQLGRIDETYHINTPYVWRVINQKDDIENMPHPFHAHGTQFRIISRNGGLPYKNEIGWKDTFIVNDGEVVDVLVKFTEPGMFMYHCHNLEHEENGMMIHFKVEES